MSAAAASSGAAASSASANPYQHYQEPILGDDDDQDDLIDPDDATLDDLDDPLHPMNHTSESSRLHPTNTNSSTAPLIPSYLTSRIPGEERTAALSTLDETVWSTLSRDLLAIWVKLREVLLPRYLFGDACRDRATATNSLRTTFSTLRQAGLAQARDELVGLAGRAVNVDGILGGAERGATGDGGGGSGMSEGLRNWDLWGPLIFVLLLSLFLSAGARNERDAVFSGIFALVWGGMAVVTGQIRLLGGNISFAQSVCIIGYTLFPLVVAALLSMLGLPMVARIPVYIFLVAWSLLAGVSILGGSGVVKNRVGIAVYPLFVFYVGLGTLCFIS